MFCAVLIAASMVVGQAENNVPENVRGQMAFLVGDWTFELKEGDESHKGTYSARWSRGRDCLILNYRSDLLSGTAVQGWNPAAKELVESWYSPTHGHLELKYNIESDDSWTGTVKLQDPDGTTTEGTSRLEKHGKDAFTYTETLGDKKTVGEYQRVKRSEVSNHHQLEALDAFVGKWEAKLDNGGITRWTFAWSADKNFLDNKSTILDADGNVRYVNNGMLGWDKSARRIVNWCVNTAGTPLTFMWRKLDENQWETWQPSTGKSWKLTFADDKWSMESNTDHFVFQRSP